MGFVEMTMNDEQANEINKETNEIEATPKILQELMHRQGFRRNVGISSSSNKDSCDEFS